MSMENFAAFAARLPRLTALALKAWRTQADVARALSLCGAATSKAAATGNDTCIGTGAGAATPFPTPNNTATGSAAGTVSNSRITRLTLVAGEVSALTLQAVREACPHLDELHLEDAGGPIDARHWTPLTLVGGLFAPLHSAQLKHLEVGYEVAVSRDMMASLGGLVQLEVLSMSVSTMDTADLCLLTGLRRLQHCYMGYLHPDATLVQAACLFHSTGLVSFRVNVKHPGRPSRGGGSPAEVAAAVALLGGLASLEVLDLGRDFFAGEAETAALMRCCRLQELKLGGLRARAPSPRAGHLPELRILCVGVDEGLTEMLLTPSSLLQALLPLLPLPSLTSINRDHQLQVDISLHGADDAGTAALAADLRQALLHLAAAPQLQFGGPEGCGSLCFSSSRLPDETYDPALLSLLQLGDALLPWTGRLQELHLTEMDLPSEGWEALQERLPDLAHLHLDRCKVRQPALVAVAEGWTALRLLTLFHCDSPRERGWVKMAQSRAHSLLLDVQPEVDADVVARCREVQEDCYGEEHIKWVASELGMAHNGAARSVNSEDEEWRTVSSESTSREASEKGGSDFSD